MIQNIFYNSSLVISFKSFLFLRMQNFDAENYDNYY